MLIGYLNLAVTQVASGMSEPSNELIACGVQRMFVDIDLGGAATPQLDVALAEINAGDTLVSPCVDMMARSIVSLLDIHKRLEARGAHLRVLRLAGGMPLDTATAEGRAILGALAVMSALPPQVTSVAATAVPAVTSPAVSNPVANNPVQAHWVGSPPPAMANLLPARPRGRPATAVLQAREVTRLRSQGLRAVEIAAHLGIGRASVYRILNQVSGTEMPDQGRIVCSATTRVM